MKLALCQLDAFTDRRFGGNRAAVLLLDAWLPDEVLAARIRYVCRSNHIAHFAKVLAQQAAGWDLSAPFPSGCEEAQKYREDI